MSGIEAVTARCPGCEQQWALHHAEGTGPSDVGEQLMRKRATSLGPHDMFLLDQWGRQLYEAFGEYPYLVGSVARADDNWRDVDLRLPVEDDDWWRYDDISGERPQRLLSLNLAISLWGRQVTGLPIDFQFQSMGEFRATKGPAHPLIRSKAGWR